MRVLIFAALLALGACATGGGEVSRDQGPDGEFPFAVERGTALPPPAPASAGAAPPQGAGAGGLDLRQWRAAAPTSYAPAFQTRLRQR